MSRIVEKKHYSISGLGAFEDSQEQNNKKYIDKNGNKNNKITEKEKTDDSNLNSYELIDSDKKEEDSI